MVFHYTTYLAFSNSDSGNALVNASWPRQRRGLRSVFGEDAVHETLEFLIKERDVEKHKTVNVKWPLCTARIRMGGVEIQHQSFLISALNGVNFTAQSLYCGEGSAGINLIVSWVSSRGSVSWRRRKSIALSGNRILGRSACNLVIQSSNTGK